MRLVNLRDFSPNKLSIESSNKQDIIFHKIRYDNGGFYLKIDNFEGYFNFVDNIGTLSLIFTGNNQNNEYDQILNEILWSINKKYDKLKSYMNIKLFENDLPVGPIIKINSITLVIRSIIEKNKTFYTEISLNHCLYKTKEKRIDIDEGIDIKKCKETSRECNLCKFYYFLNYGPYLCNGCYNMSLKAISMQNLAIINHNGNAYRVNFAFMRKKDEFNLIKNAIIIDKKGIMSFNPNKTPIEIIKKGAFGGTYLRDIYSSINGK